MIRSFPSLHSLTRLRFTSLLRISKRSLHRLLAIETSCDDAAVAIVNIHPSDRATMEPLIALSATQHAPHEAQGGIVPAVAASFLREQLPLLVSQALSSVQLSFSSIDSIAVTRGPGMQASLDAGIQFARAACSLSPSLQFMAIHHMEAHTLMARFNTPVSFPYICVLVSGGHTLIVLVHQVGDYEILAQTLDESIGNSFDKVARDLGIAWMMPSQANQNGIHIRNILTSQGSNGGAGAALEQLAKTVADKPQVRAQFDCSLTEPCWQMTDRFKVMSFSGLQSHARERLQQALHQAVILAGNDKTLQAIKEQEAKASVAYAFQEAALDHLMRRVIYAVIQCRQRQVSIQHLVVSGGVACNERLRLKLNEFCQNESKSIDLLLPVRLRRTLPRPIESSLQMIAPPARFCCDNALMIAWTACERMHALKNPWMRWQDAVYQPVWPLDSLKEPIIKNVTPLTA